MLVIIEVVAVAFVLLRVENIFSNTEAGYILKRRELLYKESPECIRKRNEELIFSVHPQDEVCFESFLESLVLLDVNSVSSLSYI